MMALPHEGIPPFAVARTIVDFLNKRSVQAVSATNLAQTAVSEGAGSGSTAERIRSPGDNLSSR